MKIAPRDIAHYCRAPSGDHLWFLLHGADRGLMRERATQIARHFCQDLDDPFQSVTLQGSDVASDAARLSDEVGAYPVFGGERIVRLQGAGTEMLSAVKAALPLLQAGTRLIIEASDTTTRHALVKLAETEKQAASIGCYADESRDIGQLARDIFAKETISISQDALSLLISRLGSDRMASRSEIEKLALYAGPNGQITSDDIEALLGDSSAQAIDLFMKTVISGDIAGLSPLLAKARQEEIAPILILRQMAGLLRQIYEVRSLIEQGTPAANALSQLRPPVHFKMKPLLSRATSQLNSKNALMLWDKIIKAESDLKSGQIGDVYAHMGQLLLGITLRLRQS